jgi:hypothetical protein
VPHTCSVCDHDDLSEINAALASNEPLRTIADRWSVSKTALIRHRNRHLPVSELKAKEAEEVNRADDLEEVNRTDDLFDQVRDLRRTRRTLADEHLIASPIPGFDSGSPGAVP